MISTQRLIMLVIGINLLIGMVGEIWVNPTGYTTSQQLEVEIDKMEDLEVNLESEEGIWGSVKQSAGQEETTIGSAINWGYSILGVFIRGINPLSIHPSMFTNTIEQVFAWFLIFFRSLIATILGIELYLVYKNKKTS